MEPDEKPTPAGDPKDKVEPPEPKFKVGKSRSFRQFDSQFDTITYSRVGHRWAERKGKSEDKTSCR